MTTTPDPVSAHDLAEALRDAVRHMDAIFDGLDWHGEAWQALLDRYDAQVRGELQKRLDAVLQKRDHDMEVARKTERNWPRWYVSAAREGNWQALRLRRELRALGGDA